MPIPLNMQQMLHARGFFRAEQKLFGQWLGADAAKPMAAAVDNRLALGASLLGFDRGDLPHQP